MSAITPYVSPYRADFTRYGVSILTPEANGSNVRKLDIPNGQWWRVIYLNVAFVASAVAATRVASMTVDDAKGTRIFQSIGPLSQVASQIVVYEWAPGVTSYSQTTDPNNSTSVTAIPDLLWPTGGRISVSLTNTQAGDNFAAIQAFAMEIYTMDTPQEGQQPLAPTPTIL